MPRLTLPTLAIATLLFALGSQVLADEPRKLDDLSELEAWAAELGLELDDLRLEPADLSGETDSPESNAVLIEDDYVSLASQQEPVLQEPVLPPQPELIGPSIEASGAFGSCDICGDYCRAGFFFGVEGTFLAPINEPSQSVAFTNLLNGTRHAGFSSPNLGAGVRAWLGIRNCNGTGFRIRYWHLGNCAMDLNPVVPVNGRPAFHES